MDTNIAENRKPWRIKIDGFIDKIPYPIKRFFYSDYFFILMGIIALVAWITGKPVIGFVGIAILSTIMLIVIDDVTPGIPMILFAMTSISSNDISGQLKYIPIFVPTILALIFHIIVFRGRWKLGKMFVPQIVITVAMLIGGCTCISSERYLGALGYSIFLGIGVLAIYEVFNQYCKKNPYTKMTDYFARFLIYVGIVVFVEIVVYYARIDLPIDMWAGYRVDVGWSISTNLAMMLLLTMPMCFYMASKSKLPCVYIIIGIIEYFANIMTLSRGGILFGFITLVFCLLYLFFSQKNKKRMFFHYVVVLAVLGIVYACIYEDFNALIKELIDRGAGSSGRKLLYKEAWEGFKNHPIFGLGMGYDGPNYTQDVINFYWFHSTFFQIIGSMGLVGVVAYGYFYIVRYKQVIDLMKVDKSLWFFFFSMLGFELYSMIDTGTFIPVPFMTIMIFINMVLETEFMDVNLSYEKMQRKMLKERKHMLTK